VGAFTGGYLRRQRPELYINSVRAYFLFLFLFLFLFQLTAVASLKRLGCRFSCVNFIHYYVIGGGGRQIKACA
jgi:hypothetical protein